MKVLYLSCHAILEYDEFSLLREIGVDVFSVGAYLTPNTTNGKRLRPPINDATADADDLAAFRNLVRPGDDNRKCLTRDFLNRFDAVIVMHKPDWVEACFQANSSTPIIWRTIGQSRPSTELRMSAFRQRGLKIIRYSPLEQRLQHYCGQDALIRFGKSLNHFEKWTGNTLRAVTFSNRMRGRSRHCSYATFRAIVDPFKCDLYGADNDDVSDIGKGAVPYAEQLQILSQYRVFVYTGTYPASYTLAFMEAWLSGIPIVAIGRKLWEIGDGRGALYEVPDLITHNVDGFVSDDISILQSAIRRLLENDNLARDISGKGRETAKRLFDAKPIGIQWRDFLNRVARRNSEIPTLQTSLTPITSPGDLQSPKPVRVERPTNTDAPQHCNQNSPSIQTRSNDHTLQNKPRIVIVQSCDETYAPLLAITANVNEKYAARHGYTYQSVAGNLAAVANTSNFNRYYLLRQEIEAGTHDWALWMDADAIVIDDNVLLEHFINHSSSKLLIACRGTMDGDHDINNGVFLLNLRHQLARDIVEFCIRACERIDPGNTSFHSDQRHMHKWLFDKRDASGRIHFIKCYTGEEYNCLNYDGPFIRHVLREFGDYEQRVHELQRLARNTHAEV